MFNQNKDKKAWICPEKVFCQKGRDVYLWSTGDLKKVASCKVQPYKSNRGLPVNLPGERDNLGGAQVDKEDDLEENNSGGA